MQTETNSARGVIFDIDHFSTHDGPGIRSVVYLKGCPLRCVWCHSPESQSFSPEPLRIPDRCNRCPVCAGALCANSAWFMCGREVSAGDVLDELLPDKVFFGTSGGGVTVSGGEPLAQPDFTRALLTGLRDAGVHTVLETSGMAKWTDLATLAESADLFYYDIKAVDPNKHRRFIGIGNDIILSNLERLAKLRGGKKIALRAPLIPGYNDSNQDLLSLYAIATKWEIGAVHLLPYNISAGAKYEWLDRPYAPGLIARQSAERLAELCALAPPALNVSVN